MKKIFVLLILFCSLKVNGQDYFISFAGIGASSAVSSVKIENLTSGKSLNLNGNDVLHLTTLTTGINTIKDYQFSELKIYPNPMNENSIIQICPPSKGNAIITLLDMNGRLIFQNECYLEIGKQEFHLSGINSGLYLFSVKGSSYQYSERIMSNGQSKGIARIEKINGIIDSKQNPKTETKAFQGVIDMNYSTGDILKFEGISSNYRTVITDTPNSTKTITFNFISCIDGEYNNYSVVHIGTQYWMGENLATSKYNDGISIPLVTDLNEWETLLTSGFCFYNNDPATYKATYGALYNWYSVNTGRLCPIGWHIPNDAEWGTMVSYLGGFLVAGRKLKETGTTHWLNPNIAANNSSGFTALPGGRRGYYNGTTSDGYINFSGLWWSSTGSYPLSASHYDLLSNNGEVYKGSSSRNSGYSVRCLKD